MCWVALDRGIRLAAKRSFPSDKTFWKEQRDKIYEEIMEKGWNEKLQTFVQSYGSETLDAANLMMPLTFFVSPSDKRILSTLDATLKDPADGGLVADSLVYRYNLNHIDDGLDGEEGTFNICTFWMVEALTRAGHVQPKKLDQARLMFEQMLTYANHLGLYAEETGSRGEALGNFPQAFTHLSLISAAFNLDKVLDG
jgi:GH15 family glucan-1,4-alpha-glucosidase